MTFVINRWVRGKEFFGRKELVESLKARRGKPTWVLGNRRVGKTSLLRQMEWLCRQGTWEESTALYWDLQGAGSIAGMKDAFLECLEDAPEVCDSLGLNVDHLDDLTFFEIINKFRRKVKARKQGYFLLLVDEAEELVDVARDEPGILASFRKLTQASTSFGLVLAGSFRLMDLDESQARTSPFLPDFLPPLLLEPFTELETRELLLHHGFSAVEAREIFDLTFGNPHLIQVVGDHLQRDPDRREMLFQLRNSKICHYFFQSNFLCLPESMRGWWGKEGLLDQLAQIQNGEMDFVYARQAALVRLGSGGSLEINPLLRLALDGHLDYPSQSEPSSPPPVSAPKPPEGHVVLELMAALGKEGSGRTTLPHAVFTGFDAEVLSHSNNPPSLQFLASLEESREKMLEILAGASPEYVLEDKPSEATLVYLVGLHLYHHYFEQVPFHEVLDPWERAARIAEDDIPVEPEHSKKPIGSQTAMVLMRCLRAKKSARYDSLAKLKTDLSSLL